MDKLTDTPSPSELAQRLKNAEAALHEAVAEQERLTASEAEVIIAGESPEAFRKRLAASTETTEARQRAVEVLRSAYQTALVEALPGAVGACTERQRACQRRHSEAVRQTLAAVLAEVSKLDTATEALNAEIGSIRVEALEALGLADGTPEAARFGLPTCGHNGLVEIRRMVERELNQ